MTKSLTPYFLVRIGNKIKTWAVPRKKWAGYIVLPTVFFLIVLIVAGNTVFSVERTFLVSVRTSGLDVQFSGNANAWSFSHAQICKRRPQPRRGDPAAANMRCDPRLFESIPHAALIIQWPHEAQLEVRQDSENNLVVHLLSDLPEIPKGSLILIDRDDWLNDGAFAFTGTARLGTDMASGTRRMVYEGRYEIRETSLISRLVMRRTNVIKTGDLMPGEAIRVVQAGNTAKAAQGFGHLTVGEVRRTGFNAVFVSARGDHALEISSFGASDPQLIFPDWVDSAISSPFLLALAFIISFIGGAIQLTLILFRSPSARK